jgi:hypothetical protein
MEQNQVKVGQVCNLSATHGVINPSPPYPHILPTSCKLVLLFANHRKKQKGVRQRNDASGPCLPSFPLVESPHAPTS